MMWIKNRISHFINYCKQNVCTDTSDYCWKPDIKSVKANAQFSCVFQASWCTCLQSLHPPELFCAGEVLWDWNLISSDYWSEDRDSCSRVSHWYDTRMRSVARGVRPVSAGVDRRDEFEWFVTVLLSNVFVPLHHVTTWYYMIGLSNCRIISV